MSIEEINNTPVIRFTQMFLENILASPKKSFSLTFGKEVYTLTVKKRGKR